MRHTNRTLVVEGGDHYKILEQIFHILEPHSRSDIPFYPASAL